ncbi:hypothetical protein DFJ74DRAFT_288272 [Hyaloraphidium curvatum]|nr:hypothetical protein DFJ74DRAFT_288272 [Hyaloraphidium curvatum]
MSQGATGGSPRRPGLSLSPRRPPLPTAARAADAVTLTERGAAALALWARIRRRPPDLDGDLVLQVLDVYRYTVDGNWEAATDLTAKGQYAYDLVLSDGIDKAKVVLDPALNNLVATGAVSKLDFICLRDLRRAYDSSKPSVPGVNVLLDFEVLSPRSAAVQLGDRKPSYPRGTELPIRIRAPAIGGRGAYLPAHGIHPLSWRKRSDIPTRTSLTLDIDAGHPGIPDDHPTIAEMLALYIGKRPRGFGTVGPGDREEEPAILGRVVKKMAWMWYGKPSDGGERFPCLFSFTIADCSAGGVTELQVNVWNQLSIDLFHPVQINDIVWLEGYKARNVKDGAGVEVMLNTRNPKGVLRIVRPAAHLSSWPPAYLTARLPPPLLRLPGSHLLQRFPDNTELEHAGLLVHVGLVEREIAGGEEAEYRWCVVRDLHSAGGGGRDVAVKVYTSAGLGAVRGRMAPGFHLLATHLRLLSSATPAKKPGRLGGRALYLVATRATQAWCFDPLDPGGWWFLDGEPGEMVRKMCVPREMWGQDWTVGGNADPARPLADYGALARMRPKLPDAVPFPRLEEVAGALVLGERKRIWVVCRVNAVWLPLSGGGSRRLLIRNTDEAEGVEGTPDADARPEAAESERDAEDQNAAPEPEPEPEPEAASGAQKRPLEDAATPASKRPKPKETPASIFGTIGSFFGFGRNRNGDVVEGGIVEGVEEVENGEGAEGAKEAPAVEGGEGAEKEQEVLPEEGSADGRAPQPEDDLEVVIEISEPGTPML